MVFTSDYTVHLLHRALAAFMGPCFLELCKQCLRWSLLVLHTFWCEKNVLAWLLLKWLRHSKYAYLVGEKKRVAVVTLGTKALWKGPYYHWLAVHCFIVVLLNVGLCTTWHMPTCVLSQRFRGLVVCVKLEELKIFFLAFSLQWSLLYFPLCFYLAVLFFPPLGAR